MIPIAHFVDSLYRLRQSFIVVCRPAVIVLIFVNHFLIPALRGDPVVEQDVVSAAQCFRLGCRVAAFEEFRV